MRQNSLVSYYPQLFHQSYEKGVVALNKTDTQFLKLNIEGMVCKGCEENINHSVSKIEGVLEVKTSYKEGTSFIEYDSIKTNSKAIKEVIKSKGCIIKNSNNE